VVELDGKKLVIVSAGPEDDHRVHVPEDGRAHGVGERSGNG
jgi:phosphatidylserine decarboxylase